MKAINTGQESKNLLFLKKKKQKDFVRTLRVRQAMTESYL